MSKSNQLQRADQGGRKLYKIHDRRFGEMRIKLMSTVAQLYELWERVIAIADPGVSPEVLQVKLDPVNSEFVRLYQRLKDLFPEAAETYPNWIMENAGDWKAGFEQMTAYQSALNAACDPGRPDGSDLLHKVISY